MFTGKELKLAEADSWKVPDISGTTYKPRGDIRAEVPCGFHTFQV